MFLLMLLGGQQGGVRCLLRHWWVVVVVVIDLRSLLPADKIFSPFLLFSLKHAHNPLLVFLEPSSLQKKILLFAWL